MRPERGFSASLTRVVSRELSGEQEPEEMEARRSRAVSIDYADGEGDPRSITGETVRLLEALTADTWAGHRATEQREALALARALKAMLPPQCPRASFSSVTMRASGLFVMASPRTGDSLRSR